MKYKTLIGLVIALLFGFALAPAMVHAGDPVVPGCDEEVDPFCLGDEDNPIGSDKLGDQNLVTTIESLIDLALGLLGIIAVIIILIGGFKWMTAGGNEDKVAEARKLIIAGIIGVAIILSAWAIAEFVISRFGAAVGVDAYET